MKILFLALCLSFFLGNTLQTWAEGSISTEGSTNQAVVTTNFVRRVSVEEFASLLNQKNAVILDVRTAKEFSCGHIKGATNINFFSPDFESALAKLDKSKTYLVYCASGGRSLLVCQRMHDLHFPRLFDLAPGFSGWVQAKKPMEL